MRMTTRTKNILGFSILIAPFGFAAGWLILVLRTETGPNAGWFLSHVFLLISAVLFVPALLGIRSLAGEKSSKTADIDLGLALLGTLALTGQFAIDLAVGQLANSSSEMSRMFDRVYSSLFMALSFQVLGVAFYAGLAMLIILLLRLGVVGTWPGILTVAGVATVLGGAFSSLAIIILLGFAVLWAGLVPVGMAIIQKSSPEQK
jgi:hypothetical protein